MKASFRINVEINKQIIRDESFGQRNVPPLDAAGLRALCTLIETRVGEFNHVNVATAFRKLLPLQDRRDGASRGEVEQALRSLELSALQNIEDFGSREIANTLHAMAKSRYRLSDRSVLAALERQAEAVAGSFNAQDVANTLWAYATMRREPGAGVMRGLEQRADRKSVG